MSDTKTRAVPKAAVVLTKAAEQRIADLMAKAPDDAIGVKLSTPRRGCSGLAYSVDYVTEEAKFDEKIETPGGLFFIDSASVLYLIGSTMELNSDFSRRVAVHGADLPLAELASARGRSADVRPDRR